MIDPLQDTESSVELLSHMGDDLTVVNAARVSMAKHSDALNEGDRKLIKYLVKHQHWTPFSHPQIQFRLKMPIFVARQWFKHTVGFARNEVSRRYVKDVASFWVPQEWRMAAENVKQGSSDVIHPNSADYEADAATTTIAAYDLYLRMIDAGVCPEQARSVLPQSMYTEFYETGSLAAYARLCKLRLDPHAQAETRAYARAVSDLITPLFPYSWSALMEGA